MSAETYLNHPTFGLLFRVCLVENHQELFTTLYSQRLFFVVDQSASGLKFEPISRADARFMVESRLRMLRRAGQNSEYTQLQQVHQRTFQGGQ
jgi:PII interaction protein X